MSLSKLIAFIFLLVFFASCSNAEQEALSTIEEQVAKINSKCPITVDSETRLDGVQLAQGPSLMYKYTLVKVQDITDTVEIKKLLWPGLLAGVRTNSAMAPLKEAGFTLCYRYQSAAKKYLFTVVIAPKDYK